MPRNPTPFSDFESYYFKTPLYEALAVTAADIRTFLWDPLTLDGYCPLCGRASTFDKPGGKRQTGYSDFYYDTLEAFQTHTLSCVRDRDNHKLTVYSLLSSGTLQKVGQHPSFADIAIDESKGYSKLLTKGDTAEFHKAIGLATHGVGIGSYVYLRRIFERLIWKRFHEFKTPEKWDEAEFKALRMKEKIELLTNYLPEFLVKNAKLYSILSLGVHELDEKDCLAFFPVLRQSTIWILEQDRKKQEELSQKAALEQAIANFRPPSS
ncbi:hypothetical protein ACQR18_32015 [Bradyrhizobium oligotrophicum]|uniref:hypothetical protein n=1 Tax=Bradyrhizobium oligotrophicum TaxID=44255 RepID=UPI003EB8D2F2